MRIIDGRFPGTAILPLSVTASKIALANTKVLIGGADAAAHEMNIGTDAGLTNAGALTINAGVVTEAKLSTPVSNLRNAKRTARFVYDWAVDGGVAGAIPFRGDAIPANAKIIGGRCYVVAALTSGGAATAGISSVGANDIVGNAAVAGAPWSVAATHIDIIPQDTFITDIVWAAGGIPALLVAAFNLTAGKLNLWLDYIVTD